MLSYAELSSSVSQGMKFFNLEYSNEPGFSRYSFAFEDNERYALWAVSDRLLSLFRFWFKIISISHSFSLEGKISIILYFTLLGFV